MAMMRILLAVNDSPAGLAAARAAIHLAKQAAGQVRAVHVLSEPGPEPGMRRGSRRVQVEDQRPGASAQVLEYVAGLADRAGVTLEALTVRGQPARSILDEASAWEADVIVLGRSGIRHVGQPFVGSQVLHVLEFAEVPVVVVPA
jgi:nucleotide-binding universal stress UspA family protein